MTDVKALLELIAQKWRSFAREIMRAAAARK